MDITSQHPIDQLAARNELFNSSYSLMARKGLSYSIRKQESRFIRANSVA